MVGRRLLDCTYFPIGLGRKTCEGIVKSFKTAKIKAENAYNAITSRFKKLGEDIQCALPLQPKGLAALMASRANSLPRRSDFLACATC